MAVLAGRAEVKPAPLDLPNLSRLLYLSAGVVRTMDRDYGIHPFRAAGSAGGRFPLELYVAVPPGGPLPAGVHWYDPLEHALVQVGPPPRGGGPAIVVTGIPWRTGWRYGNAATGTCTGTPARCWPSCWRSPTRRAWRPGCTPASPMRRWPR